MVENRFTFTFLDQTSLRYNPLNLTCKATHKGLNVCDRVEVVEWNRKKRSPPFPCCLCELSVSVKENPNRKKKQKKT